MKKHKKKESLIHVKLEYQEAVISKRDILKSEIELLKLIRAIKKYRAYRTKELIEKNRIKIRIVSMLKELRRAETLLPKLELPKILEEEKYEEEKPMKELKELSNKIEEKKDDELEQQLKEIQSRLQTLQ